MLNLTILFLKIIEYAKFVNVLKFEDLLCLYSKKQIKFIELLRYSVG